MDDDLREHERRWQASRTPEDAERYRAALVRAGRLGPDEPLLVAVHGRLPRTIYYTEFLEVAAALLAELGEPLGPWSDDVVELPHPTQWTASATETRRSDGRRTLALERIEDRYTPGGMESQDRSSAGRIEGLPGGARLGWSAFGAGDELIGYAIRGPATGVHAIERAWVTVCERHAVERAARDRAAREAQAAAIAKAAARRAAQKSDSVRRVAKTTKKTTTKKRKAR